MLVVGQVLHDRRVVAVQRPVAGLGRQARVVDAVAHAALNALQGDEEAARSRLSSEVNQMT